MRVSNVVSCRKREKRMERTKGVVEEEKEEENKIGRGKRALLAAMTCDS